MPPSSQFTVAMVELSKVETGGGGGGVLGTEPNVGVFTIFVICPVFSYYDCRSIITLSIKDFIELNHLAETWSISQGLLLK